MKTENRRGRNGAATGIALLFCSCALPAFATDKIETGSHTVFLEAPAPEQLAGILFPVKYRAVNPSTTPDSTTERQFGLMINFAFDSAEILPESEPLLQSLGEMLGIDTVANRSVVVEGHTDSIGSASYNQRLSEMRAQSIKRYLVEEYGVSPQRLIAVGRGERELYKAAEPKAAINRRVSFRPAKT